MEKNGGEQVTGDVEQSEKPEKKMSTFYMPLVRTFYLYIPIHLYTNVCKNVTVYSFDDNCSKP